MDEESESASAAAPKEVERLPMSEVATRGERATEGIERPVGETSRLGERDMDKAEAPPPAAVVVSLALRRICPVIDSRLRPRLGTAEETPLEESSDLEVGTEDGAKKPFDGGERPEKGIAIVMGASLYVRRTVLGIVQV